MKSRQGKMWRDLALEWQELATWRGQALRKVWLLSESIQDQSIAKEMRAAIVGDFIGYDGTEESSYFVDEDMQEQREQEEGAEEPEGEGEQ